NQRGQDAAFAKQVRQDLRDAHWQAKAALPQPERGGIHAAGADEWNAAEHVLQGEQVAQPPASGLEMIEAPKAWQEAGVKGEGMLVAVI
ncbi:hypothetical protein H1215_11045, partial [Anoxybacillus sp. LAT_38]